LSDLQPFAEMAQNKGITQAQLALSFAAHYPGITTIIPGIRTPHQAELNADAVVALNDEDMKALRALYDEHLSDLMTFLETTG
jgi:aryl-alcohol dehydrogenase-like predicted oxidoreductase